MGLAQYSFEAGANEGAIRSFGNDDLPGKRLRLRFELVSRLARAIVRSGFGRIVSNVVNRPLRSSPSCKQRGNIFLRLGIVALTPAWVIDSSLNIDHDQRSFTWQRCGETPAHSSSIIQFHD